MACEPDLFTQTYDALWKLFECFPAFTSEVEPGNRIKLNKRLRNPIKDVVRAADMPEVILYPIW